MNWRSLGFFVAAAMLLANFAGRQGWRRTDPETDRKAPPGWDFKRLALASFLTLFAEMALIRWISTEVRIFAYVKNLALLLCFLGFGVGCALARQRVRWRPAVTALIGLVMVVRWPWGGGKVFEGLSRALGAAKDIDIWATGTIREWPGFLISALLVAVILLLMTFVFIPMGQVVSAEIDRAPGTLRGYSWNLAFSLAGILAFFLVSWLGLPPAVWLTVILMAIALLQAGLGTGIFFASLAIPALLLLHDVSGPEHFVRWTPYQQIEVEQDHFANGEFRGALVEVNHTSYQYIVDLSPAFLGRHPGLLTEAPEDNPYNLPFRFSTPQPKVLIVGSGTGNDVAAAVRNGSRSIDAVEIDPTILALGATHPERPYSAPQVKVHLTDARAWMKRVHDSYDLVLFGLLDSHTELSDYSNMRIDNFVYTKEAFREAQALLAPDGVLFIKFHINQPWMGTRLEEMLADVFSKPPVVFFVSSSYTGPAVCFVVSPSDQVPKMLAGDVELGRLVKQQTSRFPIPGIPETTDDWPYLYQRGRSIPVIFLMVGILVLLLAAAMFWQIPDARRRIPSLFFFSMGAGFLLLETQVISRLALYFGTTWQVNGIVIAAVLAALLLANAVMEKWADSWSMHWSIGGLLGGILFAYLFPFDRIPGSALMVGTLAAVVFVVPVFFAGTLFAGEFRRVESPSAALGANMLGAVVVGLLEDLSLITGLKALLLVAFVLYCVAAVSAWRKAGSTVWSAERVALPRA
jgi:spermidine synthase